MHENLESTLRKLRLSGLAGSLDVRLQEAAGHGLNHIEFLELVLQDELAVRQERLTNRRVKAAAFRDPKTLETNHSHCTSKHSFLRQPGSGYSVR
jgi:DNA replication protein DnaC